MTVPEICAELQRVQRAICLFRSSRIRIENSLLHGVAVAELDYYTGLDKDERKSRLDQARQIIADVQAGKSEVCKNIIKTMSLAFDGFAQETAGLEKEQAKLAKLLPVAEWVKHPDRKGFGFPSLGAVIGETGDLSNYDCPGKVWKRLGLAPFQSGGKVQMGSTWRSKGGLNAAEWKEYGYSPRRRSVAWNIGECLVKGNKGPYRQRFDTVKAEAMVKHPDWAPDHPACKGTGKTKGGAECSCKGTGKMTGRVNNHAKLLATKMLIRDLWVAWHGVS